MVECTVLRARSTAAAVFPWVSCHTFTACDLVRWIAHSLAESDVINPDHMAAAAFHHPKLPHRFPLVRRELDDLLALRTGSKFDGNSNALLNLLGRTSASGTHSEGVARATPPPSVVVGEQGSSLPPQVTLGTDEVLFQGGRLQRDGFFIDEDSTSWTATVDYGDGSAQEVLALGQSKTLSLSHRFSRRGAFRVTILVTDNDGGIGTDSFFVIVT